MFDSQVITGSHDKTIKMWDLRKHTTMGTLTYHKKSVRAMAMHPTQYAFAAASAESIKKYQLPLVSAQPSNMAIYRDRCDMGPLS